MFEYSYIHFPTTATITINEAPQPDESTNLALYFMLQNFFRCEMG